MASSAARVFFVSRASRTAPASHAKRPALAGRVADSAARAEVVDVRLRPDRAAMGIYALAKSPDKGIQKLLTDARIRYCSLVELGNVFLAYGNDWRERYARLLEQAGELLMDRVNQVAPPFCLMCAEKRHEDCHRQQIADYVATRQGYELEHL